MNPFDYVNDASFSKKNLMRDTDNDELAEKGYNPWLTNLAFSQHPDTILVANEMNKRHYLDNRPQYEFFLNIVRPRKRFGKWPKKAEDENLAAVCNAYQCNTTVAREYLKLLTKEQIEVLKKQQYQGGKQ